MPSIIPISHEEEKYLAALRVGMPGLYNSGVCACINCQAPDHVKKLMVIIDRLKSELERREEENGL